MNTILKIATCIPKQEHNRSLKLEWLRSAIARTPCDLFLTPQEYFGGHVAMPDDLHIEKAWVIDKIGSLASDTKTAIGVGAAIKNESGGATEDYLYFGPDGVLRGLHRKFALPSYDDVRSKGAGQLWPEVSYAARTTPVEIKELGLVIGTVFCWEIFSLSVIPAYSFRGVNLIVHPIKFAPRGWPKNETKNGLRSVVSFGVMNKGRDLWKEKLLISSAHECFCPIAVSCNTWSLGEKFMALCGHVDEVVGTTKLIEIPSQSEAEHVHVFEMKPAYYSGLDFHFSAGAFKEHVGDLDGFHKLDPWTMQTKIRRLEAHFIGGTTRMDCILKTAVQRRQKQQTAKRFMKHLK